MRWVLAYRLAVIALLALILAQMAGVVDLRTLPHDARRLMRDLGNVGAPKEEAPAPPPIGAASSPGQSGILRLYADDIERAYQRSVGQSQGKP